MTTTLPSVFHSFAAAILLLCLTHTVQAEPPVLQAPVAGEPFSLGELGVVCAKGTDGFGAKVGERLVRPPTDPHSIGKSSVLMVAASEEDCPAHAKPVTLIATAPWPAIDLSTVVFSPDEARLDAKGRDLDGVTVLWDSAQREGQDTCRGPPQENGVERCAWALPKDLPADPQQVAFSWLPAGARAGPGVITFGPDGRVAPDSAFALAPAKVIITRLVPIDASVDLSTGLAQVPLLHPEAVVSADCGALQCDMADGKLLVRAGASLLDRLQIKLRLRAHVFLLKRDDAESQVAAEYTVLHCPMSIVSGPPVRNNTEAKVVVKLEGHCAQDLSGVRFLTDERPLEILQEVVEGSAAFVLLGLGSIGNGSVAITATRGDVGVALAVARANTRAAPLLRATLDIADFPNLPFVPTNRAATVHTQAPGEQQRWEVLPLEGIYQVAHPAPNLTTVRADPNATGLVQLQFGLRATNLPAKLADADLAVVEEPLQRSIEEANVPAAIGESAQSEKPLIEVLCGGGPQATKRLVPGIVARLPFSLRDTCRVIFHRERMGPEYGRQKLNFEIEVTAPDGTLRSDAHVSEIVSFRAGKQPRYAWIHGITTPFDRFTVRVSHVADEDHYLNGAELKTGAPAAQWTAIVGTGRARLYATTTIPTGLYRFGDKTHSGPLALNFGIISRLTWLDAEGHEGFLGIEAGMLVLGLPTSSSTMGNKPLTQVGGVAGLGIAVPIANRATVTQASINLHAWVEVSLTGDGGASRYAFIFGPSISIGNVGANL